jgi:hypothetical protein
MLGENTQSVGYTENNQLTINQMVTHGLHNDIRATLFLFSPTQLMIEARRPHLYTFNDSAFMSSLCDALNDQVTTPVDSTHNAYMLERAASHLAVVPSAIPQPILMDPFAHMWKFILKVDNDPLGINGTFRSPIIRSNRVLYMGICLDEPCNPVAVNGHTSINTNAVLQVTHQTYVDIKKDVRASGAEQLAQVLNNRDIIVPNFVMATDGSAQTSNAAEVLLDPNHMRNSYIPMEMNTHQFAPIDANLKAKGEAGIPLETEINSPRKHMQVLFQPLFNSVQQLEEKSLVSGRISTSPYMPLIPDPGSFKDHFDQATQQHYRLQTSQVTTGFNPSQPKTIAELLSMYPGMIVQPLKIPYELPVDTINPTDINDTNTMSSIISTSTPSYLTSCGLSHIAFSFISYVPTVVQMGAPPYDVQVHDIGTLIPEAPEITQRRWHSFFNLMKDHVFSTIRDIVGEFEVNISAQGAGSCFVQLQLLDFERQMIPGYTVTNNFFGSINTPMIGSQSILENNVNQFATLLPQVSSLLTRY